MVETGEGRVFTICNQLWQSAYLGCVDSPRDIHRSRLNGAQPGGVGESLGRLSAYFR